MNWWLAAGGLMASICGAGHAIAGRRMFYRPIRSAIADERHAGVLTGMWRLITIHFVLSALALFVVAARGGRGDAAAWLIAAQFAAYAAVYLVVSLRLGGALKLFQRIPFGSTAILTAVGAIIAP
jgi:protein-S-isoprenylcysteine O-methyltransferase Ste14